MMIEIGPNLTLAIQFVSVVCDVISFVLLLYLWRKSEQLQKENEQLREENEYLKAHTIHDQYKAESEGEERGYRMGYEDGLADGKGGK